MELFVFVLLGLISGFFAGLLGLGGGVITVPVMSLIALPYFNVPSNEVMHVAIASSLAAMIPTAIMSTYGHHQRQGIIWSVAIKLVPGLLLGSVFGAFLAIFLPRQDLQLVFAIFLFVTSVRMLFSHKALNKPTVAHAGEHTFVAIVIASLSALLGVGGGTMTVPYLTWRGMALPKAIGISAFCGLPIAAASTLTYYLTQSLDSYNLIGEIIYLPAVIGIALGSMLSAPIGAGYTHRFPVHIVKCLFSVVLLIVSVKLLLTL